MSAQRRRVTVYFDPREGPRGRWLAIERRGDIVHRWHHETEEGARRLAGLRPRKQAVR